MQRKRIYIAAPYPRRVELLPIAHELLAMGHYLTCRWMFVNEEDNLKSAASQEERMRLKQMYALQDLDDVKASEIVLSFTVDPDRYHEQEIGRGGRHVEFGYGYLLGRTMVNVGKVENIFHVLPNVITFDSWEEARPWFANTSELIGNSPENHPASAGGSSHERVVHE